jgi:hypothetical protein
MTAVRPWVTECRTRPPMRIRVHTAARLQK